MNALNLTERYLRAVAAQLPAAHIREIRGWQRGAPA